MNIEPLNVHQILEMEPVLRRLTTDDESMMNMVLSALNVWPNEEVTAHVARLEHDQIVGWSVVSPFWAEPGVDPDHLVQVYVQRAYRRRGIGSELVRAARREHGPITLLHAGSSSKHFWDKLGILHVGLFFGGPHMFMGERRAA